MQSGILPLRPLTVGELLDAAVALLRAHAPVLLTVGVLLAALEQALLYPLRSAATATPPYFLPYDDRLGAYWLLLGVGFGLESCIIALLGGLTSRAAAATLLGERLPARRLITPSGGRFAVVALIALAGGLTATLAALACLLPWILVYAAFGLVVPALVIDRVGPVRAVGRSAGLATRGGLRAAGVRLVGYLAWLAIRLALGIGSIALLDLAVGGAADRTLWLVAAVAWTAVNAVAYPALACLDAVLHLETRMRSEGLDIVLGRSRATGQPAAAALVVPG